MIDLKRYAAILLSEGMTTVDEVTSVSASKADIKSGNS
jgi:hypothetical protein